MKILLAVDGSPSSSAAVDEVCRRPWPIGSEVRVITVLPNLDPYQLGVGRFPTTAACDYYFKEEGEAAAKLLDSTTAAMVKRAPGLDFSRALLEGRPKDAILEEAERWGADLIILGSHGYGAIGRFFLGSVSLAVALNASCSVEIVRRPADVRDGTVP
jgi:nucleotide-binding universal stress UspA family protein